MSTARELYLRLLLIGAAGFAALAASKWYGVGDYWFSNAIFAACLTTSLMWLNLAPSGHGVSRWRWHRHVLSMPICTFLPYAFLLMVGVWFWRFHTPELPPAMSAFVNMGGILIFIALFAGICDWHALSHAQTFYYNESEERRLMEKLGWTPEKIEREIGRKRHWGLFGPANDS